LAFLFNSPIGDQEIERLTAGGGRNNLNAQMLSQFRMMLPPLPEQRKIVGILSTWDEAIRLTEQLIGALKRRKQALTQLLLTGEVRFAEFEDEVWRTLRLGEFLKYTPRKVIKPNQAYTRLGLRNRGQGTFTTTVDDPEDNEMDFLFEVKTDDLVVSITFAWEGAITVISEKDDKKLVSHRFPTYVFDRNKVFPDFFKYQIISDDFIFKLGLISPGGAGRNRVLSKTDFPKLTTNAPSLTNQRKIADVMTSVDSEIAITIEYLQALQTQKRGLMQQLLTGEIRV